jgi:hypothetical protein
MRRQRTYLALALVISILVGIILPLALGVKDPTLLAIFFSFIWFVYAALILVNTFLGKGWLKIKVIHRKDPTVVRFELPNPRTKE